MSKTTLLSVLWAVTALLIAVLAGFLYLHATLTDGWKEDLIDVSPVMVPLLVVLLLLSRALWRDSNVKIPS